MVKQFLEKLQQICQSVPYIDEEHPCFARCPISKACDSLEELFDIDFTELSCDREMDEFVELLEPIYEAYEKGANS